MNAAQTGAMSGMWNAAMGGGPGMTAANNAAGFFTGGGGANPYATMTNPYFGATNPYAGDNPYLNKMIEQGTADITKSYGEGIGAQTDAAAIQAGAYGGSGYQQQVKNNQDVLAQNLSKYENDTRYQNYLNSAQLAQADLARNAGLGEGMLSRSSDQFNNQMNRIIEAGKLGILSQSQQQAALNNLFTMGERQYGYDQNRLDAEKQKFLEEQMAPWLYGSILQGAYSAVPGQSSVSMQTTNNPNAGTNWPGMLTGTAAILAALGIGK
jgi:hypothetical protein